MSVLENHWYHPSKLAVCCFLIASATLLFAGINFGMPKLRHNVASSSSRYAMWHGLFLQHVDLTAVQSNGEQRLVPDEAWVESVVDYGTGLFERKRVVGKRLCVRIEHSHLEGFPASFRMGEVRMRLNGEEPRVFGYMGDRKGRTFQIPLRLLDKLPDEGEIAFVFKESQLEFAFRYRLRDK